MASNGIFQSLLSRLNRVFNKDPRAVTAFQIKSPVAAKMVIEDRTLVVTGIGQSKPLLTVSLVDPYDAAKSITIARLYRLLEETQGFTVQNLAPTVAPLGALSIIEGEYNLQAGEFHNVVASTALLWAIFRPVARLLEQSRGDIDKAVQQLGFVTAEGDFLDYWGEIFGIPRFIKEEVRVSNGVETIVRTVEADYEYSTRLLWETVKPRLNNKALEDILTRGVGLDTQVVDLSTKMLLTDGYNNPTHLEAGQEFSDPTMVMDAHLDNPNQGFPDDKGRYMMGERYNFGSFGVFIDQPITSPLYSPTTAQIEEIVERHRAAGTTPWFIINQVAHELLDLLSSVVYSLEADLVQEISEDRVMFFGHDDTQFYFDHWAPENVAKMPWYQNNLDKPSLMDNVVMESEQHIIPETRGVEVEGIFADASVGDGFAGSFNRNVLHMDSNDETDDFGNIRHIAHEFITGDAKTEYVFSPVILKYQRVTDDFITPRIEEGLSDDILTVLASDATSAIAAFNGAGIIINNNGSGDVVITNPIRVVAPTSITGVKFDEIALRLSNIHDIPTIIRNLEIPNFPENWQTGFTGSRRYLIPFQDVNGNRYWVEIEIPNNKPAPVVSLKLAMPTAMNTASKVQIVSGEDVTITWSVTQAASAKIYRRKLIDKSLVSSTDIIFQGAITYQLGAAVTEDTQFTIEATGNNGQIASHTVTVRIVAAPSAALPPVITGSANPEVVQLCATSETDISYTVDFKSKQTENQNVSFPAGADSVDLVPLLADPAGTVIMSEAMGGRVITVSNGISGDKVEGSFAGLGTERATFTPANPTGIETLTFNYDVNFGGSTLKFNGAPVELPNSGEVFQISQNAHVTVPNPVPVVSYTEPKRNLIRASEPTAATPYAPNGANITLGSLTDNGLSAGYQFAAQVGVVCQLSLLANSALGVSNPFGYALEVGKTYCFSCYIKMFDGSAPVPGGNGTSTADFSLVIGNVPSTVNTVQLVSGTLYRVWASRQITVAGFGQTINGIWRYAIQTTGKGFTATGFQFEEGTTPTAYQKTPLTGGVTSIPSVYTASYEVEATNYAATSTRGIPVVVQAIQEGSGIFKCNSLNPNSIVEAIGDYANESPVITLNGTGFSSNMEIALAVPREDTGTYNLINCPIVPGTLDWQGTGKQNLWPYSNDATKWNRISGCAVTNTTTLAPDDTLTASRITPNTGNAYIGYTFPNSGAITYTFSVWLKAVTGTPTLAIQIYQQGMAITRGTKSITLTNYWKRYEVTGTMIGGTDTNVIPLVGGASTWDSATEGAVDMWGAQLEVASSATDTILTNGDAKVADASLKFVAPRLLAGWYGVVATKKNCIGQTVAQDDSLRLEYRKHPTFYMKPTINDVSPRTICINPGFTSKEVILTGENFRTGIQVYMWVAGAWVAKTTTFLSASSLKFVMDVNTYGNYSVRVVNTDTSDFTTPDQPLTLLNPATAITIDEFGYVAPKLSTGCVPYGVGFTLHWRTTNAAYVSFLSSDAEIQPFLDSPDPLGWPSNSGGLSLPVYKKGTTITITAINACGKTASASVFINDVECERTTGIEIVPKLIRLKDRSAYKVHTLQKTVKPSTGETFSYDITDDANLTYSLSTRTSYSTGLSGKYITAIVNGSDQITASWKGFSSQADIFVELPEPMSLEMTVNGSDSLLYNNIGEQYQLKCRVTYTDGSVKEDVSRDSGIKYGNFDGNLITVSTIGLITTAGLGQTYITGRYTDASVNPTKTVTDVFAVGKHDPCLGFQRMYVEPAYSFAGNPDVIPITFNLTGVNAQVNTVMANTAGEASLTYTGKNGGTDIVRAVFNGMQSDPLSINWMNFTQPIVSSPVRAQFWTRSSDYNGSFSSNLMAERLIIDTTVKSLNFNDSKQYGISTGSRPVYIYENGSSRIFYVNGQGVGVGALRTFNAAFSGKFFVKAAGVHTFWVNHDDSYILSIGNGATRVSGADTWIPKVSPVSGLPVMGGMNRATEERRTSVTVSFPKAGWYPYDFTWVDIISSRLVFAVQIDGYNNVEFVDIPEPATIIKTSGNVALEIGSAGPFMVGETVTVKASLHNLDLSGKVKMNLIAANVRNVKLNDVQIYSGDINPVYSYSLEEKLSSTKTYRALISNFGGSVTATAVANILTFPQATINKMAVYDAANPNSPEVSDNSLKIKYASPMGLLWNCSNATKVMLYDDAEKQTFELPAAGSRYFVPFSDRTFTLIAYSADGSSVSKQISIDVEDYQHYTHDWRYGNWYTPGNYYREFADYWFAEATPEVVALGQSSKVSLPQFVWEDWALGWWNGYNYPYWGAPYYAAGYYDSWGYKRVTDLNEQADQGFSTDGTRPRLANGYTHYTGRTEQYDALTVAPSTNTFYHFNTNSTWFWWYWDDATYREGDYLWSKYYSWKLPYRNWWSHLWGWGYHTAVNVDPGPKFVNVSATPSRVNAGSPITISYESQFASTVLLNVASGKRLPIGKVQLVVYPDKTTDYTFTAVSPTGLTTTTTVHVDVTPQVMYAPCAKLPVPMVNYIAIDGLKSTEHQLHMDEDEAIKVLEIFGAHFLGDRASTPELIGKVQLVINETTGANPTNLAITEISGVSNDYIRCKIRTSTSTVSGAYTVSVMNDVGISSEKGSNQSFRVHVTVPRFIMNTGVTAHPGDLVTFYIDSYDPIRDAGLVLTTDGGVKITPVSIGATLSDVSFILDMYWAVFARAADDSEIGWWLNQLENKTMSRYQVMEAFLASDEYIRSGRDRVVGVGTKVTAIITATSPSGVGIQTNSGVSPYQIQYTPIQNPPNWTPTPTTNPTITSITPMSQRPSYSVTVYGTNYTNQCVVYLGSVACVTTYVDANTLTFMVPTGTADAYFSVNVKLNSTLCSYNSLLVFTPVQLDQEPVPDKKTYYHYVDGFFVLDSELTEGYRNIGFVPYVETAPIETVQTANIITTSVNNTPTYIKGKLYYYEDAGDASLVAI